MLAETKLVSVGRGHSAVPSCSGIRGLEINKLHMIQSSDFLDHERIIQAVARDECLAIDNCKFTTHMRQVHQKEPARSGQLSLEVEWSNCMENLLDKAAWIAPAIGQCLVGVYACIKLYVMYYG